MSKNILQEKFVRTWANDWEPFPPPRFFNHSLCHKKVQLLRTCAGQSRFCRTHFANPPAGRLPTATPKFAAVLKMEEVSETASPVFEDTGVAKR